MADGNVVPCTQISNNELVLGNVNENTLEEIWNGKIITKLREEHLEGKRNKVTPCNKCGITF